MKIVASGVINTLLLEAINSASATARRKREAAARQARVIPLCTPSVPLILLRAYVDLNSCLMLNSHLSSEIFSMALCFLIAR